MSQKEEPKKEPYEEFPWHSLSTEACMKELHCPENTQKIGLTSSDAAARLQKYGPNRLSEKEKVTLLQRIWKQVANVLVGILVFVAVVSAIRAATAEENQNIVTNWIQVGLIVFVITYVFHEQGTCCHNWTTA
jgi:Ca2+-transporting ATPase